MIVALESRVLQASDLDPARLKQLQAQSDASLRVRAQKFLAAGGLAPRDRNQVIATYRPAVQLAGDREKGRDVFARALRDLSPGRGSRY